MTKIKAKLVYADVFNTKKRNGELTKISVTFLGNFNGQDLTLQGVVEPIDKNLDLIDVLMGEDADVELTFNEGKIKEYVSDKNVSYFSVKVEAETLKEVGFKSNSLRENLSQKIEALTKKGK